ncbi:hypothetical protein [Chelatococcus asaccharovorans]|uniref:Uncharacterized protein n=1 Tax=Chelatococcus asaccharovorans TaxID=28210 RepID=A0A2V3U2T9_9HYPH|nr:hypothetical protein [Chelatococcus asaccharovorans]MBS7702678.1 hypothetical protein [Chelatococcus asaccharovorans]PXW56973.1 hypothetical protein C7450_10710 [Chelatococcus asaccharovorans]
MAEIIDHRLFHDAPIEAVRLVGDEVHFAVEEFSTGFDTPDMPPTTVSIRGIRSITRNGEPEKEFTPRLEFGAIYSIKKDTSGVTICIEWDGLSPRASDFGEYVFEGADVDVSLR